MKRKSLTMILCLLTCLSLVGVGFAAWVISSGDTETVTGNITVDSVSDERFTFDAMPELAKIHYGMDNTSKIEGAWLTNEDTGKQNLKATFEVKLTSKTALTNNEKATWDAAVDVTANFSLAAVGSQANQNSTEAVAAYEAAKTAKAISVPAENLTVNFVSATTTTATYQVVVEFAWGEAFDANRTDYYTTTAPTIVGDADTSNNLNPYAFYNAKTGDAFDRPVAQWGDDAYYYLDLIQKIESLYYNITVTANPVNA